MPKRSSFWGSFWRETGKNTGKWTSNKIFGSGWSTPYKHIVEKSSDETSGSRIKSSPSSSHDKENLSGHHANFLFEKADEIDFNSNHANEITQKLDDLLQGAHQAIQNQSSVSIFTAKIRSGIQRLRRLGDHDSAVFYQKELNRIHRSYYLKIVGLIIISIIVFGALAFFAFFAN